MHKKQFWGVSVFLRYKGKYLFQHRDDIPTISNPNKWCFPSGTVEDRKSFKATAIREMKEEFNIDLGNVQEFFEMKFSSDTYFKHSKFYFADLTDDQVDGIILGEGQGYAFMTFDEAMKKPLASSTDMIIRRFKDQIESMFQH